MRKGVLRACAAERDSREEMVFASKEGGKKETSGRTKMWHKKTIALLKYEER